MTWRVIVYNRANRHARGCPETGTGTLILYEGKEGVRGLGFGGRADG
jgi:hypothetical protein